MPDDAPDSCCTPPRHALGRLLPPDPAAIDGQGRPARRPADGQLRGQMPPVPRPVRSRIPLPPDFHPDYRRSNYMSRAVQEVTKGVWWRQRSENKGRRDAAPGAAKAPREPIPVFSARTRDTERHSNDEPVPCSNRTDCRWPGPRRSERRTRAISSGPPGTSGSAVGVRRLMCPSDAHRDPTLPVRRGTPMNGRRRPVRPVMRFRAG